MPELPEVETIKQQLEKNILGKKILKVEVITPKIINQKELPFKQRLEGSLIKGIKRRAKILIWELINGDSLIFHLKLTGRIIIVKKGSQPTKYTHVVFYFDKFKIFFEDLRKFGYIKLLNEKEKDVFFKKLNLGPEILDKNFTLDEFKVLLQKKKKSKIKPLLMDQSFIAGVGNIYAQEACFYAKISPKRQIFHLSNQEIKKLYNGLKEILVMAIKKKGSSVDDYLDLYGKKGDFAPLLKVYGRQGKNCYRCQTEIKFEKINGRGTCFCPKCQH